MTLRVQLPEVVVKGQRLGRHVHHDPRSLRYRVTDRPAVASAGAPVTKSWKWLIPTLDQGNLGSCTGNGSTHQLGCDGPLYQAIAPQITGKKLTLNETEAVAIYSLATQLDSFTGTYPPTDTGSDGLSAAKACQKKGLISGYTHATSTDDIIAGLQAGAGMVGTNWTTNMDSPDPKTGVIKNPAGGTLRGGHEYCVSAVDVERGLFGFRQSWGQWGIQDPETSMWGRFYMQVEDFAKLLDQQGDATFFTPLTEPAPTPTPTPGDPVDAALVAAGDAWEPSIFSKITKAGKFKTAFDTWKTAKGYK